jgi:hypothetical protein
VPGRLAQSSQDRNVIPKCDHANAKAVGLQPSAQKIDLRALSGAIDTREAYESGKFAFPLR